MNKIVILQFKMTSVISHYQPQNNTFISDIFKVF